MNPQDELQAMIETAASTKEKLFYAGLRLFSKKGFANVGIRELARSVNIKESSFYNHYTSKDSLFEAIIDYFDAAGQQVVMSDEDISAYIRRGDVRLFLTENMQRFAAITSNVQYHTALQIVLTESFLHPKAAAMAKRNLYHMRREYTERVLRGLMEHGAIIRCDVEAVTAEYYYALKGILDEYLLRQLWGDDMTEIERRITAHIRFFTKLLTPPNREEHTA